jgi:hypothetical protein
MNQMVAGSVEGNLSYEDFVPWMLLLWQYDFLSADGCRDEVLCFGMYLGGRFSYWNAAPI